MSKIIGGMHDYGQISPHFASNGIEREDLLCRGESSVNEYQSSLTIIPTIDCSPKPKRNPVINLIGFVDSLFPDACDTPSMIKGTKRSNDKTASN